MKLVVLLLSVLSLEAQMRGGFRGAPAPVRVGTPGPRAYPAAAPGQRPGVHPRPGAGLYPRRVLLGGGYYGGGYTNQVLVEEVKAAPPEDKLKELVVSPVYQKENISPKLIEIP